MLSTFIPVQQSSQAAGRSVTLSAADLLVTADSTWTGCISGGYYPIRMRISNRGPECNCTARFTAAEAGSMPTTTKRVTISQNETVNFTLLVPLVSRDTSGQLLIEKNGQRISKLKTTVTFENAIGDIHQNDIPALLIIDENQLDLTPYGTGMSRVYHSPSSAYAHSRSYSGTLATNYQVIPPEMLPDSWLAYSGLDLVALSLKTLEELPAENRAALLQWVETGGNLIVYEVGQDAPEPKSLTRLLQLDQRKSVGEKWGDHDLYAVRDFLQGHLISIPVHPFRTVNNSNMFSDSDWQQFFQGTRDNLQSLKRTDVLWGVRHGVRPRAGHSEFYYFLIPGIRGVPAFSFIALITIFSFVIGPINYFFFWKQKQLSMLVITIPLIAFTTSLCLFGYSAIAHGFGLKSRLRSLTIIDQGSNTAVTTTRMAIFAGVAPSRGLQFSPQTAVYPLWPGSNAFQAGQIDWTEQQAFTGGWLRSRTRTQFVTVSHQAERGRLGIRKINETDLNVDNGFETELDCLIVTDDKGQQFYSSRVPAGASAELKPMTQADWNTVQNRLHEYPLEQPAALTASGNPFGYPRRRHRVSFAYSDQSNTMPVHYNNSAAEVLVQNYNRDSRSGTIKPNSYFALFRNNPGLDTGYAYAAEKASRHCLIGYY